MSNIFRKVLACAFLAGIFIAMPLPIAYAQDAVPPDMQAAIFKKVFGYSKSFTTPEEVTVLVAADNPSSGPAQEIVKAFKDAGLTVKAVPNGDLSKSVAAKSVIYVVGSAATAKGICEKSSVMSITGNVALVEGGDVAVGLGVEGGKPKIVVHKARLDAEKQELSAKLLQLAKVIG